MERSNLASRFEVLLNLLKVNIANFMWPYQDSVVYNYNVINRILYSWSLNIEQLV